LIRTGRLRKLRLLLALDVCATEAGVGRSRRTGV